MPKHVARVSGMTYLLSCHDLLVAQTQHAADPPDTRQEVDGSQVGFAGVGQSVLGCQARGETHTRIAADLPGIANRGVIAKGFPRYRATSPERNRMNPDDYPTLHDRFLLWEDAGREYKIPIIHSGPTSIIPGEEDPDEYGYYAILPTENDALLVLSVDSRDHREHTGVYQSLFTPTAISLYVGDDPTDDETWMGAGIRDEKIYIDPNCLGWDCPGCGHARYIEWVECARDVFRIMNWIGSMEIHDG
jgi:hypothetical protein